MLKSLMFTVCKQHTMILQSFLKSELVSVGVQRVRGLHLSPCLQILDKDHPGKKALEKLRIEEETTAGDMAIDAELQQHKLDSIFPTLETHSMIISGIRFDELPVVYIKATHNNTILTATNNKGLPVASESGGTVGFRNARKGTNIAAQAAAISLAEKAVKKGLNLVRVCVKGIGPGRLPAIKGLQMSGLTIVSITDTTPLPHNGCRPKKQRRL